MNLVVNVHCAAQIANRLDWFAYGERALATLQEKLRECARIGSGGLGGCSLRTQCGLSIWVL